VNETWKMDRRTSTYRERGVSLRLTGGASGDYFPMGARISRDNWVMSLKLN